MTKGTSENNEFEAKRAFGQVIISEYGGAETGIMHLSV